MGTGARSTPAGRRARVYACSIALITHALDCLLATGDWLGSCVARRDGGVPAVTFTARFNSTELRMINVEMQLVPPLGGVALDVVRSGSGRAAAQAARQNWQGMVRRVQTQRADPPAQLWEIPEGSERLVLDRCS